MPAELVSERRGATLVLTISDPATRNTLSTQVIAAGIEALGASEAKDEVRAVVLRGAGAHFCAGGNLQGLLERRAAGRAGAAPDDRAPAPLRHRDPRLSEAGDRRGRRRGGRRRLLARPGLRPDRRRRRCPLRRLARQARPLARRRRDLAARPLAAAGAGAAAHLAGRAGRRRSAARPWRRRRGHAVGRCARRGAAPRRPAGGDGAERARQRQGAARAGQRPAPSPRSSRPSATTSSTTCSTPTAPKASRPSSRSARRAFPEPRDAVTSGTAHASAGSHNRRTVEHRVGILVLQTLPAAARGDPVARGGAPARRRRDPRRRAAPRRRSGAAAPSARCG